MSLLSPSWPGTSRSRNRVTKAELRHPICMDASVPRLFARRTRPVQPLRRVSAWLADMDDWDADDADVFIVQVGRQERLANDEEINQLTA